MGTDAAQMRRTPTEQPAGSAIRLRGFVKRFGAITAVDGLDLDVPEGTCVGLLGPNGAGKSTTMKLLTAQAIADEGTIDVLGYELPKDSKQARALMGVVPQLDNLDQSLTVEQNLLVFAHLYRVRAADRREAIERALGVANLGARRDSKVAELSGGMRRRLLVARALLHRQRRVEVVELRADAHLGTRGLRVAGQAVAEHLDLARVRDDLRGQHLHRRRLAGAVGPEQPDARALGDV